MILSFSTTKLGLKQTDYNSCTSKVQSNLHKIPSLPIFRKNLLNSSRLRRRIQIDGDKFFAKLSASGPETSKIIHGIRRSRNVKWIKKFEFDPYLCDYSHLNDLRKICHKIRNIQRLNLVFRRVDFSHEIEMITPFISRFSRLKSLRVEFPRTENVHDDSFVELYRAIGNCYNLRTLDWKAIEMPEKSSRFGRVSHNANQCLRHLNHIRYYDTLKKGALRNKVTEFEESNKPFLKRKTRKNTHNESKTLELIFASTREWANKEIKETEEKEKQKQGMKAAAQMIAGLEKFRLFLIKTLTNFEDIVNIFIFVNFIPTLSHLEVEYLNCQISEMDVMAFAHGLTKVKYLKYFSLKVIQKPGLTEDCIEQLVVVLSRLDSLSKFDVYFRRLGFNPRGIQDLGNRIEAFGNIQCCCSKESIHIYRRSDSE